MFEYVAKALCLQATRKVANDSAGQPVTIVVGGNLGDLHQAQIDDIACACGCKAVINGSIALFKFF